MTDETNIEKDLRLLLRAEFADFKLALFRELQTKLDAKADVADLKALEKELVDLKAQVGAIIQTRDLAKAREGGVLLALGKGKAVLVGMAALVVWAVDIVLRYWH